MNKDHLVGVAKTIAGRLKEALGRATRDPKAVAEGKALQLAGRARNVVASTRESIRRLGR